MTELHGGNVRVESQGVGQGATFVVDLPLQPVRLNAQAEADAQRNTTVDETAIEPDLSGMKVLVVDDEEDSVATIKRILERRGAEVCGTTSMEEALERLLKFGPPLSAERYRHARARRL